ncbi:MAG: hypothetical protein KME64_27095 [Scytonematopsis contorta HA4267-MV1]|nr:hypothetical protein [Scytonematopsis contorta HA4267-MV1]
MGRWTPLILMAGGLAILLGTLLGISFPMGGSQNANLIGGRNSKVLPANLENPGGGNRNTASTNAGSNNVAQGTGEASTGNPDTTAQNTAPAAGSNDGANEPIRALW